MNTFITIWDGIKSSLYDLITIFYPTRLFDTYTNQYLVKDNEKYNHYAAQFVFQYKFDTMTLRKALLETGSNANIKHNHCYLSYEKNNSLRLYDSTMEQDSNHYVYNEIPNYNFKKDCNKWNSYKVALDGWYHEKDGAITSVFWLFLPGKPWDGTSCFNFMKEVVGRYFGEPNYYIYNGYSFGWNNVVKQRLNHPYFVLKHVVSIPRNIYLNNLCTKSQTELSKMKMGNIGDREMCFLNLTKEYSSSLTKALKNTELKDDDTSKKGFPPLAAILYSVVSAYHFVLNEYPVGVAIQASLLSYCFDKGEESDLNKINNRFYIGDWLIGTFYHIRKEAKTQPIKMMFMKKLYYKLVNELKSGTGAVRDAFLARTYSIVKGGPAPFQNEKTYSGYNELNDSILFNNYGLRDINSKCNPISWNWTGPGKLCCNTINLNGQTCITFASTLLTIDEIKNIRNKTKEILDIFIESS